MDFPRFVFKDKGPNPRHGGTFDQILVQDEAEHAAALAAGWFATLPEAIEGPKAEAPDPTDDTRDPTRAELEAKAKELGIEFSPNIGDKKLAERIQAALDAQKEG